MSSMFLYQKWLQDRLHDYVTAASPPRLKGRHISMAPQQYGAALLQAYLGQASLPWVADIAGVTLETLKEWRRQPEFLLLMDWSKALFSQFFRESLELNDYSPKEVYEIAGEFALLEDSLRVGIRTKLYGLFRNLGESLLSRRFHGLTLEKSDLRLFKRLFLFFWALESYWPSPARKRLEETFLPLARDAVWPRLGLPGWEDEEFFAASSRYSLSYLHGLLAVQLRETLSLYGSRTCAYPGYLH
ncbi:MAG: hypothetical protein FJ134_11550 [Deltaproteobacteria bacterium]|nr:hypothetical protein [Deltaproteobacteria bacterium]